MQNKFGMDKLQGSHKLEWYMYYSLSEYISYHLTRCTRGVRVVFSVTRMRSSNTNSARINKFDFRTEKIV